MNIPTAPISDLLACSVCWGSDGKSLDAANAGVGFMLVLLVGVFGSLLGFIWHLARKSREAGSSEGSN